MKIEEILLKNCMCLDRELEDKQAVFSVLIDLLYNNDVITDKERFLEAVNYRESLSLTGLIDGVAIPHGECECVTHPMVAYLRLKTPISWESLDDKPIKQIFLLAIPKSTKDNTHIKMISELARSLMDSEIINKLENASGPEEIIELLKKGGKE